MKQALILYLFLIPFISFSQINGGFTLDWQNKKEMSFGDSKLKIPYFSGNGFRYDTTKKSIILLLNLTEAGSANYNSIQISNIIYESVSIADLGDLSLENIPEKPNETLKTTLSRDLTQVFLSLSPIIKEGNSFKRIRSFSYNTTTSTTAKNNNSSSFQKTAAVYNSVLSSGDWYRFYVEKSGVYKLSRAFLQSIGFDPGKTDPRRIKIYGNGGKMLPLANNVYYPEDLTENAIQIIGEADGVFNNEDYILFYGEGVENWSTESQTNLNLYDTKSYYYITITGGDGKRISPLNQPTGSSTLELNTFDDYQFHEIDKTNIAHLGREWYGESFDITQEQEFNFNFPNIDPSTPVKIDVKAASAAYTPTSFAISANGQNVGTLNFQALVLNGDIKFYAQKLPANATFTGAENVKIKLTYNNNGVPGSKGYLDFINLIAKRKLLGTGKQFKFQYDLAGATPGIVNYTVGNAAGIAQIWDVTDPTNTLKIENTGQANFSFKAALGEIRKYIAIDPADYYAPLKENQSKVVNQNLKGTLFRNAQNSFQDIDYIIVAPKSLTSQAEKLATFHRGIPI
ncbi:hypothetical protein [Flavobacterium sp. N502536]|uniref:type IX secretion system sortase PorU, long form n=1 Tax=Flavobacterium sp. N502536 TaxID=2986837 RepID=UPI0029CAB0F1|nr:hypothetical protein [Flavobacterium sp. N502536]